jgi:RND family efflux transporter MFP subunit
MNPFISPPRSWALFLFVGLLSGFTFGCNNHSPVQAEKAAPAPVTAEKAEEEPLTETIDLFGSIQPLPNHAAVITANVSAPVVSLLKDAQGRPVVEGQRVQEDDVIVQLYDKLMREQLKQADVDVRSAKRKVEQQQQIKKQTPNAFSQFDMDNAELALEAAESKLRSIDEQLKLYTLRAPIAGRLGRIRIQPGQAVSPGTLVADIIDLEDEVDALCFVAPHDARKMRLHQSAVLGTSENEGPEGEVVFIAPQAEADTGLVAVKVRFPNRAQFFWQREWRANTAVHVQVSTQSRPKTWVIPAAALTEDQDPPAVVVIKDLKTEKNKEGKEEKIGKAQILSADIGLRDREHVEVLSLKTREKKEPVPIEGTWFIIKGGNGLHDDDPVKLEEEEEKEGEKDKEKDKEKEKEQDADQKKSERKEKD